MLEPTNFSESQGLLTASGKLSRAALIRRILSKMGSTSFEHNQRAA